jgi:RNA chaperone Hfq
METNLLDRMLNDYQAAGIAVTITLQNKIRVSGVIKAFDSYIILIEGQKREIVYRHAMSSLAAGAGDVQKTIPAAAPARVKTTPSPQLKARHDKHDKNKHPQAKPSFTGSNGETSINNSMKEGLLKWMQEQKAAK